MLLITYKKQNYTSQSLFMCVVQAFMQFTFKTDMTVQLRILKYFWDEYVTDLHGDIEKSNINTY